VDADNGRIETRTAMVMTNIGWLQHSHKRPGLVCIGKVTRTRETAAKTGVETAYYLLSKTTSAERFNAVVRSHWGIENRLHWRLDVIMNEDQDRNRMDNSPYNLAILRHMALNVMRRKDLRAPSAGSSNARHGRMLISAGYWLLFEMRLP
jgi:predicted transposase YbfD/YdcC